MFSQKFVLSKKSLEQRREFHTSQNRKGFLHKTQDFISKSLSMLHIFHHQPLLARPRTWEEKFVKKMVWLKRSSPQNYQKFDSTTSKKTFLSQKQLKSKSSLISNMFMLLAITISKLFFHSKVMQILPKHQYEEIQEPN